MDKNLYIRGLKRELAGRGARNPAAAEEILRELARCGEVVETRSAPKPKKAAPAKAASDSEE